MIQLFKIAYRDLGRNRRRSFFSALALGMGLALLMLMAGVFSGEMSQSMNSSIILQTGHLQLRAPSYEEDKTSLSWSDLVEKPADIAAQISALEPVQAATPRLFASGILARGDEAIGVRITGIDPDSSANAIYKKGTLEGSFFTGGDRDGVLLGQTLAKKLNIKAGDEVYLLVNTSSGDMAEQTFTVRGIYTTGVPGFDNSNIFMPLAKAQDITGAGDHASTIFVLLDNRDQTDAVAAALKSDRYSLETWKKTNEVLLQTEELSNAYISILYLIVLAITATVIVNTLVMAVFERTREIGIYAAMGMKGARIMAMFFAESLLLAIGGILIGLVLGGLANLYASTVGFYIGDMGVTGMLLGERIYAALTVDDVVTLTVEALIVTLIAALYPALLAARMEPVQALRGGK